MEGLEGEEKKIRKELGLYGDSEEEINREIKETGAIPIVKLATKPITIVCHTGDVNINSAGTFKIDHDTCIQQAEWSYGRGQFMPGIESYLEVFNYKPEEILTVEFPTTQHKKIVGLIETAVGVLRVGKKRGVNVPLFFELPETSLHPSKQACVAQFIARLQNEFGTKSDKEEGK